MARKKTIVEKVQSLLNSGMASWSGQKPLFEQPRISTQGPKTLAELLLEDREASIDLQSARIPEEELRQELAVDSPTHYDVEDFEQDLATLRSLDGLDPRQ